MTMQGAFVSQPLDITPKLLGLDIETVFIAASFIIGGGLFNHALPGAVIGLAAGALWHRIVSTHVRGFAIHAAYWLFGGFRLSRTPPSSSRRFVG